MDDELVSPANRLKIGKSILRLSLILKSKEPTLQVALDAFKLTPFYNAFEISADVPEIYMQEFLVTVFRHHSLLRFKLNGKSHTVNIDNFRDMLKVYPKLPVIVDYFMATDHAIPRRNKMFWHYARDDFMFTTTLKPNSTKKKADSESSPKTKPTQASKGKRIKTLAKGDKPAKMKQSATKSKDLTVLSEVALSEADQIKFATKISKKEFHSSHASGLGDGVDIQSKVPDEQQQTVSGTNEGAGEDDEENDEHNSEDDNDEHDSANDNDDEDDDQEKVSGETESDDDGDDFVHPNLSTYKADDQEEEKEKEKANNDDEVSFDQKVSTPPDYEITNEDENQEDDDNVLKQTNQFAKALSSILDIVDNYLASKMKDAVNVVVQLQFNKLREEAQAENGKFLKQIHSNIKAIIKDHVKAQVSKIMPKVEKYVTESLGDEVLARSSIQPQTSYDAAASFSEFELKKILIDKIEEKQSMNRSDIQKNLYNTLIELYNSDKDLFASYGTMRRRSGKEESSKEATQKVSKSTSSSKGASRSQPKSSGKSAQAEEHGPRVDDLEEPLHQEFNT
ncbi:hypothetical protein Tco_0922404 [Tanacetum coccineum]|uniref:Uncharacterized protein n=1 Tax=Tanacetum coccineum TaxID=301880 RepID=A0ABQ5CY11_9ASTR